MASLFPADEAGERRTDGEPVQPSAADEPALVHTSFSSFNAAAFLQQQQQPSSVHQEGLRGEDLNRAIDYYLASSSEDSEEDEGGAPPAPAAQSAPTATLLSATQAAARAAARADASLSSDESSRQQKKKHRKHKKKHKRKTGYDVDPRRETKRPRTDAEKIEVLEQRAAATGDLRRIARPQQWKSLKGPKHATAAGDASGASEDLFYVDAAGDRDNVVYGQLYALDQASYSRHDPLRTAAGARARSGYAYGALGETDGDSQVSRGGRRQRYFLARVARREHDGSLRRTRYRLTMQAPLKGTLRKSLPPAAVLPLQAERADKLKAERQRREQHASSPLEGAGSDEEAGNDGETEAQMLMRRAKELNVGVREQPENLQLWLDFAAFQDTALPSSARGRVGVETALAEKKIAILERALEHHPASDRLLLELLRLAAVAGDAAATTDQWRGVLRRHSGRPTLWRAYLAFRRSDFAAFTARRLRHLHDDALDALARERVAVQGAEAGEVALAALDRHLIAFLAAATAGDLASGHTEMAVARLQAALEYNCFAPPIFSTDAEKLEVFRRFWEGGEPLVGEPGARGWVHSEGPSLLTANAREAAEASAAAAEVERLATEAAEAPGGWSGWVGTLPADPTASAAADGAPVGADDTAGGAAGEGAEGDDEDADSDDEDAVAEAAADGGEEETEEQLMARLGLQLEEQLAGQEEGVTPAIAAAWAATEAKRDAMQWLPTRAPPAPPASPGSSSVAEEESLRAVRFADLEDALFTLASDEARAELALVAVELLGAHLPPGWRSSNGPCGGSGSWVEAVHCVAPAQLGAEAPVVAAPWSTAMGDPLLWHLPEPGAVGNQLRWLLPGAGQRPWWGVTPARRDFLALLLRCLLAEGAPLQGHRGACLALLGAEAAPPSTFAFPDPGDDDEAASVVLFAAADKADAETQDSYSADGRVGGNDGTGRDWDRAREAARQLLSQHRGDAMLFCAYAELEAAAGSHKASRRAFDAAAAAAATAFSVSQAGVGGGPEAAVAAAAEVAVVCAEVQLRRGGREAQARAVHMLVWVGCHTAVFEPFKAASSKSEPGGPGDVGVAQLLAARRGLQDWITHSLSAAAAAAAPAPASREDGTARYDTADDGGKRGGCGTAPSAVDAAVGAVGLGPLLAAATLLEELLPAVAPGLVPGGAAAGVRNAARLHVQVSEAVPAESRSSSAVMERLAMRNCRLLTSACLASPPAAAPRTARSAVLNALKLWPRNGELVAMLTAAGEAARGAARLRGDLAAACAAGPAPVAWLLALRCEAVRPGAGVHLQPLFERVVGSREGGTCPLMWRCYLAYELGRNRPQAARRVYLRAVHACPGAVELWRDGFKGLGDALAPAEAAELLQLAVQKGVARRTDVFEVQLAVAGAAAGLSP